MNFYGLMGRTCCSQQRLLTAASDLLWEKSYHSVTVDEVCARACVMRGSLYHFFDSWTMKGVRDEAI
jgi:TetR/AcrR family transcriptional repressor of nem operon